MTLQKRVLYSKKTAVPAKDESKESTNSVLFFFLSKTEQYQLFRLKKVVETCLEI